MFKMVGVIQEIPEGGKSFLLRYCGFFGGEEGESSFVGLESTGPVALIRVGFLGQAARNCQA